MEMRGGFIYNKYKKTDRLSWCYHLYFTLKEMVKMIEKFGEKETTSTDKEEYEQTFLQIIQEIKQFTGIDFSYYRSNSILRRIEKRRKAIKEGCLSIHQYLKYLQNNEHEAELLQQDILIGVTHFFRDPEAFKVLEEKVLPILMKKSLQEREIRIWVAGCSTGEEAYSLAILLSEYIRNHPFNPKVKIFATDIDKRAIEFAGQGIYPRDIERDLSSELLERYFISDGNRYQVIKEIRKMIVFATHDVSKDAPFINVDLVSCRNLLIYFKPVLQEKVLSIFHYAMNPHAHLMLGSSETIGKLTYYFDPVDVQWSIFSYKESTRPNVSVGLEMKGKVTDHRMDKKKYQHQLLNKKLKQSKSVQSIILEKFMIASIIIDDQNEVVQFCGNVNQYLTIPTGQASLHLSKIIQMGTYISLQTAIKKVRTERQEVVLPCLLTKGDGTTIKVKLTAKPLSSYAPFSSYLIIYIEKLEEEIQEVTAQYFDIKDSMHQHILDLEQELEVTKDILQATIEELEMANEDLQSTNEELIAANEEMQSINEEMQSTNEELISVNAENERKIEELTDLNNDMDNFLISTQIATIFLDKGLYVKRFTPSVQGIIHLLDVDIGRPISHINHKLIYSDLIKDAKHVLSTSQPVEKELRSYDGRWFSMRMLPYLTHGKEISGIVITFMDISDIKHADRKLQRLHSAIEKSPNIVVICDIDGNIEYANHKFYEKTGWSREEINLQKQTPFLDFEGLSVEEYKKYLEHFRSYQIWMGEMKYKDKQGNFYWGSVTILPFKDDFEGTMQNLILLEDITERKNAEQIIKRSEMLSALGELAAGIAHEIRNPLTALKGFTRLMQSDENHNPNYLKIMMDEFERIEAIITELLGLAKPSALSYEEKNIIDMLEDVRMLLETQAIMKNIEMVTHFDPHVGQVSCVSNQLKQVFINILKNAIEASDHGGQILISVRKKDEEWVHIQFIDHGAGISPEVLSKIGQPFFTTKEKGTGLGMMVSFKIIEDHDGKMSMTSEEGAGTTVDILLPLV